MVVMCFEGLLRKRKTFHLQSFSNLSELRINNSAHVRDEEIRLAQDFTDAPELEDLGSSIHNNNNININSPHLGKHENHFGIKEAFKNKFTIFGTLLRPKKKKKVDESCEELSAHLSFEGKGPVDLSKHSEPLNYNKSGDLISGNLDNMIYLLTPTHEYYPDQKYLFTFLLCSRLFLPPSHLLRKLLKNVQKIVELDKAHEKEIFRKFVSLLLDWSKQYPYDFKDKLMMTQFNKFSAMLRDSYPDLSASLNLIAIHLVEKFKELLAYVETSNEFPIQCDEDEKAFFDVCQDPIVAAEQLALIEHEKMSMLNPEQFVEKFIAEDITCSRLDLTDSNHATTLELYVSWFNRLSYLIATEICQCPKKKDRVRLVNFYIDVGRHCLKIGNFNSLMAIVTGLNMNAVGRMSRTWSKANRNKFRKLENELSPQGNFCKYRMTLKERTTQRENDAIIPIFSLFVKDVYFLNEGVKDKLPNKMINYEKFTKLSQHLWNFLARRKKQCYFKRDEAVVNYFLNTPILGENAIYKSSFEVEKPENNFERERFKSVRMKEGHLVKLKANSISC